MIKLLFTMSASLALAACGGSGSFGSLGGGSGSSAGSFGSGSFGGAKTVEVTPKQKATINYGPLVPVVTEVKIERVQAGAIIRVKASATRQGYYDVKLRSPTRLEPDKDGVVVLEIRAKQPKFWTEASTKRSREIVVGRFISSQKLARARSIRVIAAQNQITVRP